MEEKIIEARKMLCSYLAKVAREKNISTYEIARQTGLKQPNVSRIFSGKYSPALDYIIMIGDVLGVYFFIIDKESDDPLVDTMRMRWKRDGDVS